MTVIRKHSLAFGRGKYIPVHVMKTDRESGGIPPPTLNLALETCNIT